MVSIRLLARKCLCNFQIAAHYVWNVPRCGAISTSPSSASRRIAFVTVARSRPCCCVLARGPGQGCAGPGGTWRWLQGARLTVGVVPLHNPARALRAGVPRPGRAPARCVNSRPRPVGLASRCELARDRSLRVLWACREVITVSACRLRHARCRACALYVVDAEPLDPQDVGLGVVPGELAFRSPALGALTCALSGRVHSVAATDVAVECRQTGHAGRREVWGKFDQSSARTSAGTYERCNFRTGISALSPSMIQMDR